MVKVLPVNHIHLFHLTKHIFNTSLETTEIFIGKYSFVLIEKKNDKKYVMNMYFQNICKIVLNP